MSTDHCGVCLGRRQVDDGSVVTVMSFKFRLGWRDHFELLVVVTMYARYPAALGRLLVYLLK